MAKRTRIILFLSCFFAFLLITPTAIFYSQGYRFDFKAKKIVKTGGIFLKAEPKQVNVFINDKPGKKTDFIFGTVLIKNLLPGDYKIRVEKDGFQSWEKTLEVKEKEVAEAKRIVLVQKNPKFEISTAENPFPLNSATSSEINGDIYYLDAQGYLLKNQRKLTDVPFKNFKISPDFQKMALMNDYEIWVLFLQEQLVEPRRNGLEKTYLTRFSKKIGDVFWYNPDYLLFNVGGEIKIAEIDNRDRLNIADLARFENSAPEGINPPTFLQDLTPKATPSQEVENYPKGGGIKIFFNSSERKLYVLTKNNLFVSEKLFP